MAVIDKYIFLDIHGVVCVPNGREFAPVPHAIDLVYKLAAQTGAGIVITSESRGHVVSDTVKALAHYRFTFQPFIVGSCMRVKDFVVPKGLPICRGTEIQYWLQQNAKPLYKYVILDDTPHILLSQLPHLVHVNITTGMQDRDFQKAMKILQPHKF